MLKYIKLVTQEKLVNFEQIVNTVKLVKTSKKVIFKKILLELEQHELSGDFFGISWWWFSKKQKQEQKLKSVVGSSVFVCIKEIFVCIK